MAAAAAEGPLSPSYINNMGTILHEGDHRLLAVFCQAIGAESHHATTDWLNCHLRVSDLLLVEGSPFSRIDPRLHPATCRAHKKMSDCGIRVMGWDSTIPLERAAPHAEYAQHLAAQSVLEMTSRRDFQNRQALLEEWKSRELKIHELTPQLADDVHRLGKGDPNHLTEEASALCHAMTVSEAAKKTHAEGGRVIALISWLHSREIAVDRLKAANVHVIALEHHPRDHDLQFQQELDFVEEALRALDPAFDTESDDTDDENNHPPQYA